MRLDWLFQGPNSGFMVAKDKGYYDEAGLNVDIGPGRGSGSTAQIVASKARPVIRAPARIGIRVTFICALRGGPIGTTAYI